MTLLGRLRSWLGRGEARLIDRFGGTLDPLLQVLFQEANAGVMVMDRAGGIVRVNETLRRMLARRVDLSPGQPAIVIFQEAERVAIRRVLHLLLDGQSPPGSLQARLEAAETDPDHMVDVAVTVLTEADGGASGLVLRLSDITAQKRLEGQLAQSQKLLAVGQLAGGIAHDFNNLLTAIAGAAESIEDRACEEAACEDRAGTSPETREDAAQIRESAARGAALVGQLLAFGRQQTLQPRAVAVNAAIAGLSSLLRRLLGGHIRLVLDLEDPGRTVRVDPTQLDQVLVNLSVNARDAMKNGGTLTLRSGHMTLYRPLTRGQETIPPGRYVMIEVQDTGIGIPTDVLPRIFDPFFTTRREAGGNGLGLSTVHGIIRQSDGFLAVESEPGQGTRFRVYLPRYDGAAPPLSPPEPGAESAPAVPEPGASASVSAARLVLLVDDEDLVRRLAERALIRRGWQVLSACSGDAALELLADGRHAADLAAVISDVVMPGMDGPSLLRSLRQFRPDLPAILVSGYAEETLRQDIVADGVVFLAKPYALKELAALLDDVVMRSPRMLRLGAGDVSGISGADVRR